MYNLEQFLFGVTTIKATCSCLLMYLFLFLAKNNYIIIVDKQHFIANPGQ